ncbi:MAG TPA: stage III sporulation protein AG, partial [Candidatus Galloscillospira excrementavium]|nr:stage III sporulation protein AG [Candidatus Galloscillospira excrementavium]
MKGKLNGMAWAQACGKLLQKYKYVLLVILAGVVLLLLPRSGENDTAPQEAAGTAAAVQEFDLEAMERKLEEALSRIDGAGEVHVVLTIKSGTRQILAQDSSRSDSDSSTETVVVSRGSGVEDTVVLQQIPPQY